MYAVLHQQKALLALAEEQMHVIELVQRLVKAEQARGRLDSFKTSHHTADMVVMRDHKLAMFQAREADLLADLQTHVDHVDELEVSRLPP